MRVIEKAVDGRLSGSEAACLLQCSERQVQRLKHRYQPNSVAWVQHGNRGRTMPWQLNPEVRAQVLELAQGKYVGFNDSHLHQKLMECEQLILSRETVRRILRGSNLASPQKRRPRPYRARRPRRPRRGMMAQADASCHDWLEGRGPRLTLLGFQDDATSEILAAHFQLEAENTVGYFCCLEMMITTHGVPLSLYRDRHGIFQRNDAYWTREEELLGKQFSTHMAVLWRSSGFSKSRLTLLRPRAASSAPGAPFKTVLLVNSAWPRLAPWPKPRSCWHVSAPILTAALPYPHPNPPATFAAYRVASIWLVVSASATNAR